MADLKETKEVLAAAKGLALDVIAGVKDGVSWDDISILLGNINLIKAAIEGAQNIPAEMKDLDRAEIVELSAIGINLVFDIIEALKQEPPQAA